MTAVSAALGSVPKDGRTEEENEDRAAAGLFRFALADGATDSGRAEVWAELLVKAFVSSWPTPVDIFDARVLDSLRLSWRNEVYREGLPWHAEWKLDTRPAAATFAGVAVDQPSRSYTAVAVGDCCVFHIRRAALVSAGPIADWRNFGSRPDLVRAASSDISPLSAQWRYEAAYQCGDALVLATDALAKFLLRQHERTRKVDIDEYGVGSDSFADWVAAARGLEELDNDDTTICVVTL